MIGTTAAILGAGALLGGSAIYASNQASKASKVQAGAAEQGIALQKAQYDQTRTDLAPWRDAGVKALNQLQDPNALRANFQTDPGYQFAFNEGQRAVTSGANAKFGVNSGPAMKALSRFGTGLATQAFGDYYNRVAQLAGLGQTATTATANFGQNATNAMSSGLADAANARASGYANQANALGNAANSAVTLGAFGYGNGMFGGGGSASPYDSGMAYANSLNMSQQAARPGFFAIPGLR